MAYTRKTRDYWSVEQYTAQGWEEVTAADNAKEARALAKDYRDNEPNAIRIKIRREKITEENAEQNAPTVAIFRKWKTGNRDIIALFPEDIADSRNNCSSYEHTGQHSAADYKGVIARTTPATPAEFRALKSELEAQPYAYVLNVKQRHTHAR